MQVFRFNVIAVAAVIFSATPVMPITLTGNYDTSGRALAVALSGNYAYVARAAHGLFIVDISNPLIPSDAGDLDTSDSAYGVAVSGNYAYVTDANDGLDIIDISDPSSPTLAGTFDTSSDLRGVAVRGNYAYLADNNDGLDIITAAWFGSSTTVTSSTKPLQADRFSDGFTTTKTAVGVPYGSGYIPIFLALGYGLYTLRFRQPS